MKSYIRGFLEKSVEKIQVSLHCGKNNAIFREQLLAVKLLRHLVHFFFGREMFETKFVEKIKTPILSSITFSRMSRRVSHNTVAPDTQYNATQRRCDLHAR
jgi:hypothetical protein